MRKPLKLTYYVNLSESDKDFYDLYMNIYDIYGKSSFDENLNRTKIKNRFEERVGCDIWEIIKEKSAYTDLLERSQTYSQLARDDIEEYMAIYEEELKAIKQV